MKKYSMQAKDVLSSMELFEVKAGGETNTTIVAVCPTICATCTLCSSECTVCTTKVAS